MSESQQSLVIGALSIIATIFFGWLAFWISHKSFAYTQKKMNFDNLSYVISNFDEILKWRKLQRELFFEMISYFKNLNYTESFLTILFIKEKSLINLELFNNISIGQRKKLIALRFTGGIIKVSSKFTKIWSVVLFENSKNHAIFCWIMFSIWCIFLVCFSIDINFIHKGGLEKIIFAFCIWIPEFVMLNSIENRELIEKLRSHILSVN